MSEINQERISKVKKWISFADEDLKLAKYGLTIKSNCPYRLIAYHAQQCVEKHLKSYLVYKNVDFPYTHNISRLLELRDETGANWTNSILDAEELTPYAITTRYPGEDSEVTKEEAEQSINIAISVQELIRNVLLSEGINLLQ